METPQMTVCHRLVVISTGNLRASRGKELGVGSRANRKPTHDFPIHLQRRKKETFNFCSICHNLIEIPMAILRRQNVTFKFELEGVTKTASHCSGFISQNFTTLIVLLHTIKHFLTHYETRSKQYCNMVLVIGDKAKCNSS